MPEHIQVIMINFFLKTSVPRILADMARGEKEEVARKLEGSKNP